jgi:hypothetical protein
MAVEKVLSWVLVWGFEMVKAYSSVEQMSRYL